MQSQVKVMPQHGWADAFVSAYKAALEAAERDVAVAHDAAGGFYRHAEYV